MLCVRCKHELPPRADRCLRCFALNPQNRGAATPKPAPKAAATLSIESKPPQRLPRRDLSIESDPPPFGNPLQLSLESDPPRAAVALDFSSDPAPPERALDPRFDEIPAEEIDELAVAGREPSFHERPTEPPTLPPPAADTLDDGTEVEHLRARLAEAASAHDWDLPGAPEEEPLGPGSTSPFASPLPPRAPGRPAGPMGLPPETTPGWLAAQPTAARTPPPAIAKARAAAEAAARADAAEEITLREPAPHVIATPPAPERTAHALRTPGPSLGDPSLSDEAPPVHPARPAARAPPPSPPPPLPTPPPPGPARAGARARLASWMLDAAVLSGCCALFIAGSALLIGRPRLAPLGAQSAESWADLLLFGRHLPLLWALLGASLGVAYSWLFGALGGCTPGQRLAGLRLRRLDGGAPAPEQALWHALLALPSLGLGLFGFLLAFVDPRGQTLHDKLTRLVVEPAGAEVRQPPLAVAE